MEIFDVIITDPPWSYYGAQDKMGAAGKEYDTITDLDLLAWKYPLSKNGLLFMWATCPRLNFAMDCIKEHGLYYRGVAFVWVKTKQDGSPIGAQGVRPSTVKPVVELVLVASPRMIGRPLKLHNEAIRQVVFAPKGEHSQKPEEVQDRIELMYPDATKAEFFARRQRNGWQCFGNQTDKFKNHQSSNQ